MKNGVFRLKALFQKSKYPSGVAALSWGGWVSVGTVTDLSNTVNSPQYGHLFDQYYVSALERSPSYRESNKGSKENQGTTIGVRFTEVSVL